LNSSKYCVITAFCLAALLLSCRSSDDSIILYVGETPVTCEIADSVEKRAEGLMYRKNLDTDKGMLFVFQKEQRLSFWMKNTFLPLSIAYIDKYGEIKEIHDMTPQSEKPVNSRYEVMFALEVNQGFFKENRIFEGDRISFPDSFHPGFKTP